MPEMKTYQILSKTIVSNRIYLYETTNYKRFKDTLELMKDDNLRIIITTNTYSYE